MFPHSDAIPARLEVTLTQFPGEGEVRTGLPLEVGVGGAVTGGVGAAPLEEGCEGCASVGPLHPSWMMAKDRITINNFILVARWIHDPADSKESPPGSHASSTRPETLALSPKMSPWSTTMSPILICEATAGCHVQRDGPAPNNLRYLSLLRKSKIWSVSRVSAVLIE